MPLNKPELYDIRFAPYELKCHVVQENCKGCGFFFQRESLDIKRDEEVIGCSYSLDLVGRAPFEPSFLGVLDIAHNTCEFWRKLMPPQEEEIPFELLNDPALDPNTLYASNNI